MKKLIAAAFLALAQLAHAGPLPALSTPASADIFDATRLDWLQLSNAAATQNASLTRSRMNAWNGMFHGALVGNYPSTGKHAEDNEVWSFEMFSDGRFRIQPTRASYLCVTHGAYKYLDEFKAGGRLLDLQPCDSDKQDQFWFIQQSNSINAAASGKSLGVTPTYVIRSISEPGKCVSLLRGSSKPLRLLPLALSDCGTVGSADDRWIIGPSPNLRDAGTEKVLKQMVDVFSVYFYHRTGSDGSRTPVYLKKADMQMVPGSLKVEVVSDYNRLPFQNPFNVNETIDQYFNYTVSPQSVEVRKWGVNTYSAAVTIKSELGFKLLKIGIDGKFEWTTSDQSITGINATVAPQTAIWFAAQKYRRSARYTGVFVSDLNDAWSVTGISAESTSPNSIAICDSLSSASPCVMSGAILPITSNKY